MKEPLSANQIGLSIVYAIVLIPIALLINYAITWAADNFLFDILDWFNSRKPLWRIFLLLTIAGGIISTTAFIINILFSLLVLSSFKHLKENQFIVIWSGLIFAGAILWPIIALIRMWPNWSFWFVFEFILMCIFVIFANYPLLAKVTTKKDEL